MRHHPVAGQINALEKQFEARSNEELRALTNDLRTRIAEATATLREEFDEAQKQSMAVLRTDGLRSAFQCLSTYQKNAAPTTIAGTNSTASAAPAISTMT